MAQPQQPGAMQVSSDPAVLAMIDAQHVPVNLKLTKDDAASIAVCEPHGLEVCKDCDLDFFQMNITSRVLQSFPPEMPIPPPPNVVHPQRSPMVQKAKDEGNALFKAQKYELAIQKYNMAANLAANRFPWETSQLMREELSMIISNRSAAYLALNDPLSALADAEAVIQIKRVWGKGHFRKAKALLALERYSEAKESVELGLQFDPENTELETFIQTIATTQAEKEKSSTAA